MKMLILNRLSKEEDKHLTTDDIKDYLDTLPFIKIPTKAASISRLLWRYTDMGLLTARKERLKHVGRPKLAYKITIKGRKRLKEYLKRWEQGKPVIIKTKGKKVNFNSKTENKERASSIRRRIKKQNDIFKYILPMHR